MMDKEETVTHLLGYEGGLAGPTDPSVTDACIDDITRELYVLREHEGGGGISGQLASHAAHTIGVKVYTLLRSLGFERPQDVSVLEDDRVDYLRLSGVMTLAYSYKP